MKSDTLLYMSKKFSEIAKISLAESEEFILDQDVYLLEMPLVSLLEKEIPNDEFEKFILDNKVLQDLDFEKIKHSQFSNTIRTYDPIGAETFIIKKTNDEPEDLKVKQSVLLIGNGSIPNLYYFEGIRIDHLTEFPKIVTDFPKELNNYLFAVHAFDALQKNDAMPKNMRDIVPYNSQGRDIKDISGAIKYITNNKSKLDNIISLSSQLPKYVGNGVDSVVFDIGNGMILKIFKSEDLYNETLKYFNILHESPELAKTETMIYDVDKLSDGFYYSITQKMLPVQKLDDLAKTYIFKLNKLLASYLQQHQKDWKKWVVIFDSISPQNPNSKEEVNKALKQIKEYSEFVANYILLDITNDSDQKVIDAVEYFQEFQEENLKNNWLDTYVEEVIIKLITRRGDLHMGNLGLTNTGEFRYFDSSHSNWTNKLNMSGWETNYVPESEDEEFNETLPKTVR